MIGFPLTIYHSPLPHTYTEYAFIPAPAPRVVPSCHLCPDSFFQSVFTEVGNASNRVCPRESTFTVKLSVSGGTRVATDMGAYTYKPRCFFRKDHRMTITGSIRNMLEGNPIKCYRSSLHLEGARTRQATYAANDRRTITPVQPRPTGKSGRAPWDPSQ